ncbi:MAG: tRNA lysidine(34) synthetase TilS [Alphaproteobacteria bacterium]
MSTNIYQTFAASMQQFEHISERETIAVGVSGGSDSMFLMLCLAKWAKTRKNKIIILTVDHKLRTESAEEAQKVKIWAEGLGLEQVVLTWEGEKPKTGVQEQARKARFNLLLSYCQDNNIKFLALAHHLEDQAETFLIRLGRGSGVDGLGAMRHITNIDGINVIRPLLNISHNGFKKYLKENQMEWVEDPSNQNDHYQRVKIRKILPLLTDYGISPDVLSKTAEQMQRVRSFLDKITKEEIVKHTKLYEEGFITASPNLFICNDDEIALRTLKKIIMGVCGLEYPLRLEKLSRLLDCLRNPDSFKGATLSGCQILKNKVKDECGYLFVRETKKVEQSVCVNQTTSILWDKRFIINIKNNSNKNLIVRPLGAKLWKEMVKDKKIKIKKDIPRLAGIVLPTLFDNKDVLLIPHLSYKKEDINCDVEMSVSFKTSLYNF